MVLINQERFIHLIEDFKNWDSRVQESSDLLNVSLYDSPIIDYTLGLFNTLLHIYFNDSAIEDIFWWLYEKDGDPEIKMWDNNDNEIPTETIADLWNIVKSNRKC